ncbi:MAG: hypothetical protein R2784_20885 [Saprospiraceae bacterium]
MVWKKSQPGLKTLYQLSQSLVILGIMDLGNIRRAEEDFIAPLVQDLMEGGIIPVIIGGNIQLGTSRLLTRLFNLLSVCW